MKRPPLDPKRTVCVLKSKDGKEVGRIAATAPNASTYITDHARIYQGMTVEYVEQDEENAKIQRMVSAMFGS